jgi:hypothetical protein
MADFYEEWKAQAKAYKPKEVTQSTLWLKQMALMSPHFEPIKNSDDAHLINEKFLNSCMQLAYDQGATRIDEESYNRGYDKAMQDVAEKLGMKWDCE